MTKSEVLNTLKEMQNEMSQMTDDELFSHLVTSSKTFREDLKNYIVGYDLNNTFLKVFECGFNSRHVPLNPREKWNGSALDCILSSCLRDLNVTQGDSYYKGILYRVFLLGYHYERLIFS